VRNSAECSFRPRGAEGMAFSQSPECGRETELRMALERMSGADSSRTPFLLRSTARDSACCVVLATSDMVSMFVPASWLTRLRMWVASRDDYGAKTRADTKGPV
jgi:hypothetical protein